MAIINIDFDGSVVTHEYPRVGKDIGAVPVLKKLVQTGHQLILFTMRGDNSYLKDAVEWFKQNDIPLYGINTNPTQRGWTNSPKSHADFIIDDTAIGTPLVYNWSVSTHPYVDWVKMEQLLIERGLL
jgi:hypothetical protein